MYCKHCGSEINQNAVVCIHCGCAVEQQAVQEQSTAEGKTNTLAIVGFVMAFIIPLAGLICSIIGYKRADKDYNGSCKGLALAGIIISAIFMAAVIALAIWGIITWIIALNAIFDAPCYYALIL